MKLINISEINIKDAVESAKNVIDDNGIIIHPTDTIYGLAGNIFNEAVYNRILEIKQRDISKAISWQIANYSVIENYVDFNNIQAGFNLKVFYNKIFPGAITIVLPVNLKRLPDHLKRKKDFSTIGFRMPDHQFCSLLASSLPYPLTTTSANISGMSYNHNINKIKADFQNKVNAIFYEKSGLKNKPSTVIQIDKNGLKFLREGAVSKKEIENVYNKCYK